MRDEIVVSLVHPQGHRHHNHKERRTKGFVNKCGPEADLGEVIVAYRGADDCHQPPQRARLEVRCFEKHRKKLDGNCKLEVNVRISVVMVVRLLATLFASVERKGERINTEGKSSPATPRLTVRAVCGEIWSSLGNDLCFHTDWRKRAASRKSIQLSDWSRTTDAVVRTGGMAWD